MTTQEEAWDREYGISSTGYYELVMRCRVTDPDEEHVEAFVYTTFKREDVIDGCLTFAELYHEAREQLLARVYREGHNPGVITHFIHPYHGWSAGEYGWGETEAEDEDTDEDDEDTDDDNPD